MNATLEEMARALFKSWFVDFEPVRAKMEGRWRPGESLPGLPAHLHHLFPDRLVDSALGEVPEGWEVRGLGDCFHLTMGQSPPGRPRTDNRLPRLFEPHGLLSLPMRKQEVEMHSDAPAQAEHVCI